MSSSRPVNFCAKDGGEEMRFRFFPERPAGPQRLRAPLDSLFGFRFGLCHGVPREAQRSEVFRTLKRRLLIVLVIFSRYTAVSVTRNLSRQQSFL